MNLARACNLPLDAALPEWIHLLPSGPQISGADGRTWTLADPSALVQTFQTRHTPLVIDWEHASEHRAPQGLDAPAAGWITQLDVRNGQLWGQVEWTARAGQQIQAREYRYLSPVFTYRKDSRQIVALTSAALTNQPNLNLTALNQEQTPMDLTPILEALGLAAEADMPALLAAIADLQKKVESAKPPEEPAANRASLPSLEQFVPRADFDQALNRASAAEQQLLTLTTAQRNQAIDAALTAAVAAGKISPATTDYYRAMCQTERGLEQFQAFLNKTPPVLGTASGLNDKPLPRPGFALNAELHAVTAQFGHSLEDLKTYGGLQ